MRLDFSESTEDAIASFDFEDHNTEEIDTIIGYKWIDIELSEIPSNVKSVVINAKMSVNNGRIGIFVPSSDFVSPGNTLNPSFDYLYRMEIIDYLSIAIIGNLVKKPRLQLKVHPEHSAIRELHFLF